ncbi:hypothetical protein [Spirosoma oryzicola]|uniref:hypothetical protein n=1 Tax=Spirosoma oryzicola TaxID=2898794 RepID=UPI001E2FEF6A|nr:hypothetical protein [Spirosoma oryzicola]UHG89026.1 hypothetical protein LQ777_12290 [Spirosoma oryzicola]
MSAKNLYQTLYQNDQLFRLAGESWSYSTQPLVETASAPDVTHLVSEPPDEIIPVVTADLLDELDALAASPLTHSDEKRLVEPIVDIPVVQAPAPEPIALTATPEPLPQPVPRPTTPSVVPPTQQPRLPQLNHKVLLLADEELDPSNLLFLEKILKAVNLNIDGVDLLNLHGAGDLDFAELVQDKKIHHFITFGVPFSRIHLDIAMDRYQPIRFFGITFLMADSLPTIEADQNLKKRLWGALQRVFLQR